MVWLCGSAVVLAMGLLLGLLGLLGLRGAAHFWPQPLVLLHTPEHSTVAELGIVLSREAAPREEGTRLLLDRGAAPYAAAPLVWLQESEVERRERPEKALVFERNGRAPLYGFLEAVRTEGDWHPLANASLVAQTRALDALSGTAGADSAPPPGYRLRLASGELVEEAAEELRAAYAPNAMSVMDRLVFFVEQTGRFLTEAPRRSNIQGGVFPAIVGTVTLVLLMAVVVSPLGVLAAIYLQEYAQRGPVTRLVRIAVNNLAGVPSIVYGVFGLGFFVYTVGGSLDALLFAERLPAPTLGTPGMLWAALTMALLTLPVVVVTTEEGLARVPSSLREGSFALGATRAETLWRVVLPAASPAVLTGLILAVARATGEVAPLLLVGVAKYAPGLPIDGEFPYLHLDRQFMHLGFSIYDIGFQSPDLASAEGLVFATALLLVLIVLLLNTAAVILRGRLREAFRPEETL